MSKFLCKAIDLFGGFRVRTLAPTIDLCVFRNPNAGPLRLRWFSISSKKQSFTVSYLIDSHGFSPKAALSASKIVAFETSEKPDKVISLFKKYGFTEAQISCVFKRRPTLLVADSEKTILPKLEFFRAKGFSWPDFAKRISIFPAVLDRSLDKHIIPTYEFFRNVLNSDEKVIMAVFRCPDLLIQNLEKYIKPNIAILQKHGVSDSNIATLIKSSPMAVMINSGEFRKAVDRVSEIGFKASRVAFVSGLSAIRSISQSRWESKVNAYKKWGWSEEVVLKTFIRCPLTMKISVDKITAVMDFLINQVGMSPSRVTKQPQLLGLSLEKRLIPRHFVFRALLSKGLVKENANLYALFESPETKFLKKFVTPYVEKGTAPELLKLYEEKLDDLSRGLKTVNV